MATPLTKLSPLQEKTAMAFMHDLLRISDILHTGQLKRKLDYPYMYNLPKNSKGYTLMWNASIAICQAIKTRDFDLLLDDWAEDLTVFFFKDRLELLSTSPDYGRLYKAGLDEVVLYIAFFCSELGIYWDLAQATSLATAKHFKKLRVYEALKLYDCLINDTNGE